MEIMKLTIKEDFHGRTHYLFSLSYHKITLFEKKYDIKLINLISMYHLKPLVSLGRFIISIAPAIPMKHYKLKIRLSLGGERMSVCTLQGGWCGNHLTDLMSVSCVLPVIIY